MTYDPAYGAPMPGAPMPGAPADAAIEIELKYHWLTFLYGLCTPRLAIDGQASKVRWGRFTVPVASGRHVVEAWTVYLFYSNMGRNSAVVDVPPGGVVLVRWHAPWFAFSKGRIEVSIGGGMPGAMPVAPAPMPGPVPQPAPGAIAPPAMPGPGQPGLGARPPIPGGTAPGLGMTPRPPMTPRAPWPGQGVAPAAPAAPGGWHDDPTGRHQHRYFDGVRWTEHVSDAGVAAVDPMGA